MELRVFSTQDLRDFFANEEHRLAVVGEILCEVIERPSHELVDRIIEELIDEEEKDWKLDTTYQTMRHVWGLLEECYLDSEFDKFLCERYGYRRPEDDRVVSNQEELDYLLEVENGQTDVHP